MIDPKWHCWLAPINSGGERTNNHPAAAVDSGSLVTVTAKSQVVTRQIVSLVSDSNDREGRVTIQMKVQTQRLFTT